MASNIHLKVRSLRCDADVSTGLTVAEGPALGMLKAAFGFGGSSSGKGKEEL